MACFIIPGIEAAAVTAASRIIKSKEQKKLSADTEVRFDENTLKNSKADKLKSLSAMLWGGSALLAFEHLWHGEIEPFFPFLTAMGNKEDMMEMFSEMSTVGVSMAVAVTSVWGLFTVVASKLRNKYEKEAKA